MSKKPKPRPQARPVPAAAQGVFLSAALIVKDEQESLPACLASLQGVVDEIVVYDTGSTDDTVAVAEAAGATVVRGSWPGNFASARNLALDHATGTWVLSVDADEIVKADPTRLRVHLRRSAAPAHTVLIHNIVGAGGPDDFDHRGARLFKRRNTRWAGHIHELPSQIAADGTDLPLDTDDLPVPALMIDHHGYVDTATVAAKCERNAEIVRGEIQRLAAMAEVPAAEHVGRMLAHLIRSEEGRHDRQAALDVGAVLAEMLPDDPAWPQSVDRLANLALGWGSPGTAMAFIRRLSDSGAAPAWSTFLEAEALRRMGEPVRAWELLRPLDKLVDTVGVMFPDGALHETKAMTASMAGDVQHAADEIILAAKNGKAEALLHHIATEAGTPALVEQIAGAVETRSRELAGMLREALQAA